MSDKKLWDEYIATAKERDRLRADFDALNEVLRSTCEELDATKSFKRDIVAHCEKVEVEVLALRKENAELFAAMMIPSYEEENRLRAELAVLREQEPVKAATYFAVMEGDYIQRDMRNDQLEIYETEGDARINCPRCATVQKVAVTKATDAIYAQPTPPSVPDVDYIVDRISEFATHDTERGEIKFDRWTLREGVEAALHAKTTPPTTPDGWMLVPVEPTLEMICEIERQWMCGSQIDMAKREWKAALAAAPKPGDPT